jgi:ABC-2 type transport system permease protein
VDAHGRVEEALMTATTTEVSPDLTQLIRVATPEGGLRHDLRAVRVVWQREMIRFSRDRLRIITSLIQPVLFLFVLGTGLSTITNGTASNVSFRTFMYPGALSMAVLFTAMFSAASIVWDREFGFLREMLVAPVSRWSIVVGKCFGGATTASLQGVIILALAGLVGVPYSASLILVVFFEMLLLAFTLTAFGVMTAARITQFQSFMALNQMLLMPLFFLSGALFPLNNLPSWLRVLTRIDPLTYAVDPIRRAVFAHLHAPPAVLARLNPGVTWGTWKVPTGLELLIVAVMGVAMLGVGIWQFRSAE